MIYSIVFSFLLTCALFGGMLYYRQRLRRLEANDRLKEHLHRKTRTLEERDEAILNFKKVYDSYINKYGDPASRIKRPGAEG